MTLKIWNSTFKNSGNRLHAHGNRLLLRKIVIKMFWASSNRLQPHGYQLPKSKNFGKRFFIEKFFWRNCVVQSFLLKKIFLYLSWCFSWSSCISWVFSWIFTLILILDWMTLWFLKLVWLLILDLSLWHHQNKLGKLCFHRKKHIIKRIRWFHIYLKSLLKLLLRVDALRKYTSKIVFPWDLSTHFPSFVFLTACHVIPLHFTNYADG